ncbi:MAG: monovalent cation/H(+) antiporter subunit G [Pseudomonadota bacterium]
METALDILSWVLMTSGGLFVLIGGIGALRLPNIYTRMHAASLTDTMASILVLSGIMLQAGLSLATIKLLAILVFLLLTGPTASYAIANAALLSGMRPDAKEAKADNTKTESQA